MNRQRKTKYAIVGTGRHEEYDKLLLDDLFLVNIVDKYMRAAGHKAGAYSILTGLATNESIKNGKVINISKLVNGIDYSDYPEMPNNTHPLTKPPDNSNIV